MHFRDRVPVTAPRRTEDGYLVADAYVARTGVQVYLGSEVGRPEMDTVRVYRPPGEVFSDATLRSFAHRPITNDHPPEDVTSRNWKDFAVGHTGDEVSHDQRRVRVPLVLMDQAAIDDFDAGKRELSQGYSAEIVWGDGVSPEGEAYDASLKNIRNNHLAQVLRGRAGTEFRIGDGRSPGAPDTSAHPKPETQMSNQQTRTVIVDGLPVDCTDASAAAIAKLQGQLRDANTTQAASDSAHQAALAAKDCDIAARDAQIDTLKGQILSDAALDQRVQQRADLIGKAKAIHDADYAGKTDPEVRKAAVIGKLGDASLADKSDSYIEARFDILSDSAKPQDPVSQALRRGNSNAGFTDAAAGEVAARDAYLNRFNRKKES